MHRYKIIIQYDGSSFSGWQLQKNRNTVQGEIENAIKFKAEEFVNKMNLVSREEFEIQKKLIEKLQKDLKKLNSNKKRLKKN